LGTGVLVLTVARVVLGVVALVLVATGGPDLSVVAKIVMVGLVVVRVGLLTILVVLLR
jgi:hypothetical protein